MTITIRVYLNEGEDHYFGFNPETAELRLAATWEHPLDGAGRPLSSKGEPLTGSGLLAEIYRQLNVGGDLVPATEYTERYRAGRNRSLSVGDVVVVGETAFAVARFGFAAGICWPGKGAR